MFLVAIAAATDAPQPARPDPAPVDAARGAGTAWRLAFARPFFRQTATLALDDLPARRVAIVVDASASMRRSDLWQQALSQVDKELADVGPHDEVALFTFADRLQTEVGFESAECRCQRAAAGEIVRLAAKKLRPTWQGTDLGGGARRRGE